MPSDLSGQFAYLASRRNEPTLPTGHTPSLSAAILRAWSAGFGQVNRLPGLGLPLPFPYSEHSFSPLLPAMAGITPLQWLPWAPPFFILGGPGGNTRVRDDDMPPGGTDPDMPPRTETDGTGGGGTAPTTTTPTSPPTPSPTSSSPSPTTTSSASPAPTTGAEVGPMSYRGPGGYQIPAIGIWQWLATGGGGQFPGGGA